MGSRDLLEVLYLAPEGDRDPSPTPWHRSDGRDSGDREARERRRIWLFIGLFAAAVLTSLALGPRMPPLGTPHMSASADHGMAEPVSESEIYRACRTMAWVAQFGGCGMAAANDPY